MALLGQKVNDYLLSKTDFRLYICMCQYTKARLRIFLERLICNCDSSHSFDFFLHLSYLIISSISYFFIRICFKKCRVFTPHSQAMAPSHIRSVNVKTQTKLSVLYQMLWGGGLFFREKCYFLLSLTCVALT